MSSAKYSLGKNYASPTQPHGSLVHLQGAMMWVNSLCLVHPREASVAWMSL